MHANLLDGEMKRGFRGTSRVLVVAIVVVVDVVDVIYMLRWLLPRAPLARMCS